MPKKTINPTRAETKILKAKQKARPELIVNEKLDEWTYLRFHQRSDLTDVDSVSRRDYVFRIDINQVTQEEFVAHFEAPLRPTVITKVCDNWPAKHRWTLEELVKHYRNERFKCGEDNEGYSVKMKFKYFSYYMKTNCDDSPLYIFDGNFGEHKRKKKLLDDYTVPKYFNEDLFKYVGESRRPPYRWIVIGSKRSGTGIHIDPLGTSAWNTLLSGYKRWCLFPTDTPRDMLKLSIRDSAGKQSGEAAQWFNLVYPKTQLPSWPRIWQPIEILQRPYETVFVPSGWWHVVMNLTDTVAITQNYVSSVNFPIVWHKTVRGRPKLSKKWLEQIKIHRPDLFELTSAIDVMSPSGITSDSSDSSSSSSSSTCSTCDCSDSDDSGQVSPSKYKRRKPYDRRR